MKSLFRKFGNSEFRKSLNQDLAFSFLFSLALILVSFTSVGDTFANITRTFDFWIRSQTSHAPKVHSSLKVLSLDDDTVAKLGYHDLSLAEWNYATLGIAKRKPAAIYMIKAFDYTLGNNYDKKFVERMRKFDFPVYVAGTVSTQPLMERKSLRNADKVSIRSLHTQAQRDSWLDKQRSSYFYGPAQTIAPAFKGFGHVQTGEYGRIQPFIRHESDFAAPHISMLGQAVKIDKNIIYGKDFAIEPDAQGNVIANLINQEDLASVTFPLFDAINKVKNREAIDYINPGDTVVIMANMSHGHFESRPTPLGRIPHNLVHLSMINSMLTNQWLSELPGKLFLIFAAGLVGTLFASLCAKSIVIPGIVLMTFGMAFSGLIGFLYFQISVPWLLPALSLTICSITSLIRQTLQLDHEAKLVRHGLEGRMSPDRIAAFLASHQQAKREATEQILTVMFIDIVGFSRTSKRKEPGKTFENLKKVVSEIRQIVHEYGGDVDRTMGDALLCVFGYNVADGPTNTSHADQALKCAEAIQRANVRRIITGGEADTVVFPLRIGINTSNAYIGNLGDSKRIDLTVIGAGVNFAQRLESACDRNMVMIGPATHDLLRMFPDRSTRLTKCLIRVKHEDELNVAYEYNPFLMDPDILRQCERSYRNFVGIKRVEDRYIIPSTCELRIATQLGVGTVVDVSRDGMAILLPIYLSVGVPLSITLKLAEPDLELGLAALGLLPITAEVRWGTHANDKYLHGIAFKNLSDEQRNGLIVLIQKKYGTLELAS